MIKALFFTLLALLLVIIGWHLFFPFLGAVIAFTAGAWATLIASVIILCVAILLAFVFAGAGIFIFGIMAFVWVIIAIALFPIIFPIVAPLFIIFLFISYFCKKK
jgi:hypothetical protein